MLQNAIACDYKGIHVFLAILWRILETINKMNDKLIFINSEKSVKFRVVKKGKMAFYTPDFLFTNKMFHSKITFHAKMSKKVLHNQDIQE